MHRHKLWNIDKHAARVDAEHDCERARRHQVARDQPKRRNQQRRSGQHHGSSRQPRATVSQLQQHVVRF